MSQKFLPLTAAVISLLLSALSSVAQENADHLEPMDVFYVQVAITFG